MSTTAINLNYLYDAQPALPETSAHVEAFSDRVHAISDLGTAFSLIAQEVPVTAQIKFRVVLEGKSQPLNPLVYEHMYRIGREALLNAFRHSRATRIDLHLAQTPAGLRMAIRDNGKGISTDLLDHRCSGLSWMKGSAERIGAKFSLMSRLCAGTEVVFLIPAHIAFPTERNGRWQLAVA
jgi:signal transduction histidine kinase